MWIDGSLRGLGASAGNAQTEVLAAAFERAGYHTGVDLFPLIDTAENVVAPLMEFPQIVDETALVLGYAGVYSTFFHPTKRAARKYGVRERDILMELGRAIAEVIQKIDRTILIIASSDMNHYESDAITRVKDRKAIDQILMMNPEGLYDVVRRGNISMCGSGPAVSMLVAAKALGASKAELVKYATSGDVSLDFDHVVGYAGIMVV